MSAKVFLIMLFCSLFCLFPRCKGQGFPSFDCLTLIQMVVEGSDAGRVYLSTASLLQVMFKQATHRITANMKDGERWEYDDEDFQQSTGTAAAARTQLCAPCNWLWFNLTHSAVGRKENARNKSSPKEERQNEISAFCFLQTIATDCWQQQQQQQQQRTSTTATLFSSLLPLTACSQELAGKGKEKRKEHTSMIDNELQINALLVLLVKCKMFAVFIQSLWRRWMSLRGQHVDNDNKWEPNEANERGFAVIKTMTDFVWL